MRQGQAKGSVLVHLRSFVLEAQGEAIWDRVLNELGPEEGSVLGGLVLVGAWYPVDVWNQALDVYLPIAYRDVDDGMAQLAQYISERDLNRVYKMVLRMGSSEFLMKRTSSLWSRYFNSGKLSAEEVSPGFWKLELNLPRGSRVPSHFTCGPGLAAWVTNGLRATGSVATVTHRCVSPRGDLWRYEARWAAGEN